MSPILSSRRPRRFRALVLAFTGLAASAAGQLVNVGTASATPVVVQLTPACTTSGVAGINLTVFNPLHDPATSGESWGDITPATGPTVPTTAQFTGPIPAGAWSTHVFIATGPGHTVANIAAQVHTPTETRASDKVRLEVDVPACVGPEDATSITTAPPVANPSAPGVVVEDSVPHAVLDPTTTAVHPVPPDDIAGYVITATTAVISIDPPVTISRWHDTTSSTLPVTGAGDDARNAMLKLAAALVFVVGLPLVLLGRWLRRNRPFVVATRPHRGHQ